FRGDRRHRHRAEVLEGGAELRRRLLALGEALPETGRLGDEGDTDHRRPLGHSSSPPSESSKPAATTERISAGSTSGTWRWISTVIAAAAADSSDAPYRFVARVNTATSSRPATSKVSMSTVTDRKSTRLNSSHVKISYAVFCLKKKTTAHTLYSSLSV